jgi:hypothetical protein
MFLPSPPCTRADSLAFHLSSPLAQVFGIDLYSLFTSAEEVIRFLDLYDPELCALASERYNKLYRIAATSAATDSSDGEVGGTDLGVQQEVGGVGARPDPNTYGAAAARLGDAWAVDTQEELTGVLAEIQRRVGEYSIFGASGDDLLSLVQNAECVVAAEE